MTLKKYQIKVTEPQYWEEVHDLLCHESSCECIPNRKVECSDEKCHSETRGTFILHGSEADALKDHPYISWVELDPTEYPESYPQPELYENRFNTDVKVYRDLTNGQGPPPSPGIPDASELNRTGWQIVRTGIKQNSEFWGTDDISGESQQHKLGNVNFSTSGENVDVVIHDAGILGYHPEFMDENGQSRVRDIVLDGPFYIDPEYFIQNGLTITLSDGVITSTEASARSWWTNSASRSPQFSSIGTISIGFSYTRNNAIGNITGNSGLISGHGTASASLVAGKNFGLAFKSNIWNMSGIGNPNMGTTPEQNFDCIKLFHLYKPINPVTGRKNPTLVNGSWGYQAAFSFGSNVSYSFRGSTGSFVGSSPVTNQVTAMKDGLNNQVNGAYKSWSSSSRSSSTDQAAREMMDAGVIYVAAAGNNNQRLGIGATDPDRLNYMSDAYFGSTDPRPEFPSGTCPCNHRDWMTPQGMGFDDTTDFHPVICVGAMDDWIGDAGSGITSERKASYSNNGPGIDVWSPADETLAAGTNFVFSYVDYVRRDNNNFYDCWFNGTSAASPVVCGVIALYLGLNPTASSRMVKQWLKTQGSVIVSSQEYINPFSDDTTTEYWTGTYNMRDAERRIIYNPYTSNVETKFDGLSYSGFTLEYK